MIYKKKLIEFIIIKLEMPNYIIIYNLVEHYTHLKHQAYTQQQPQQQAHTQMQQVPQQQAYMQVQQQTNMQQVPPQQQAYMHMQQQANMQQVPVQQQTPYTPNASGAYSVPPNYK